MEKLYIVLVDTPGFFAGIIRRVIKQDYVHVVLSLDKELEEAYSFGRRHPAVPIISGFEKEETHKILRSFPDARYLVTSIDCTKEQKAAISKELQEMYQQRMRYHYCVLGLPFILMNKAFHQKRHYTCSSFTAKILAEHGIELFCKDYSLVTPADFYDLPQTKYIYEGYLSDYIPQTETGIAIKVA